MKRILGTALMIVGLLAPGTVMAHDAKLHKGKATAGEIVSVADDRFEMKTGAGTTVVSFSSKTKFEHGKQKVDKTHLTNGAKVNVIGTKLPSGEIVAREVLLGGAAETTDHSNMKDMKGMKDMKQADKAKTEHKQH